MSPELIGVISVGVMLAGLILATVAPLRRDIGDLRGRVARLEGLFEGFIGRQPDRSA